MKNTFEIIKTALATIPALLLGWLLQAMTEWSWGLGVFISLGIVAVVILGSLVIPGRIARGYRNIGVNKPPLQFNDQESFETRNIVWIIVGVIALAKGHMGPGLVVLGLVLAEALIYAQAFVELNSQHDKRDDLVVTPEEEMAERFHKNFKDPSKK